MPVKAKKITWRARKARRNKGLESYHVSSLLMLQNAWRIQRRKAGQHVLRNRWQGPATRSPFWPHLLEMYAVAPEVDG